MATYTYEIMSSYSSNVNSLQTCNNLDVLKFKNRKCMKYEKRVTIRISKTKASKIKLFYICDDRLYENIFIDWCKPINDIDLITRGGWGVNDIDWILDEMKKKIKDELRQVWIKNHNMEANFASIKLLLIVNLMCVILLFLTTIWFIIFKLNEL